MPARADRIANWWETERWTLIAIDPLEHTQMRGLVNRAFLSRRIELLRTRIHEFARDLIDGFVDATVEAEADRAAEEWVADLTDGPSAAASNGPTCSRNAGHEATVHTTGNAVDVAW